MKDTSRPRVLYGLFVDGLIYGELDAVGGSWSEVLDDAGGITGVVVPPDLVQRLDLRNNAVEWRNFLAIEQDGIIRQAGPIISRSYDYKTGQLTLNAGDIWTYLDHRKILNSTTILGGSPVNLTNVTLANLDLSGVVTGILRNLQTWNDWPNILLPASDLAGSQTWVFDGWQSIWAGPQIRQITQQYVQAPNPNPSSGLTEPTIGGIDVRFPATINPNNLIQVQWSVETGTEAAPKLAQTGPDWVLDASAPQTPVRGISVDADGSEMGIYGVVSGNGSEQSTLMELNSNQMGAALSLAYYPMLDVDGHFPMAYDYPKLTAFLNTVLAKAGRPNEAWKIDVDAARTYQIKTGDYVHLIVKNDPFVGTVDRRMRVQSIGGTIGSDTVTLSMFTTSGTL